MSADYITPEQLKKLNAPGNKYRAVKTTVDGIVFHSKREANRYVDLVTLQKAGRIANLRLQVPYKLEVNGQLVCTYKADFNYQEDGVEVVEDCKGYRTHEYRIKKKLMKACHGITLRET
jgi:hypothetical protein